MSWNSSALMYRCINGVAKLRVTTKNRGETVTKRFFNTEPMVIHFLYRHYIDYQNHCKHQPIGPRDVWGKCFGRIGYSHAYFMSP